MSSILMPPQYMRGFEYEVYYRKSTDAGDTWMPGKRLTWNSVPDEYPIIAVDSTDNLHLVWEEEVPWSAELFYRSTADGGGTWSIGQNLTSTSLSSPRPRIAADPSGNLHLVWSDCSAWEPGDLLHEVCQVERHTRCHKSDLKTNDSSTSGKTPNSAGLRLRMLGRDL